MPLLTYLLTILSDLAGNQTHNYKCIHCVVKRRCVAW